MLNEYDSQLCRRDGALPGLATLLDPSAIQLLLKNASPDAEIREVIPVYMRYKPGEMCMAAYRVRCGIREVLIHAIACQSSGTPKYARLTGPPAVCDSHLPSHLVLSDKRLVLSTFPNDQKLKTIRRLYEPHRFSRLIAKLNPSCAPEETSFDVLTYKPHRRAVLKLSTIGRPWGVLRIYCPEDFEASLARARGVISSPNLRLPRVLGKSCWQHVLALEYLNGPTLSLSSALRESGNTLQRVACALADLHAQDGSALRPFDLDLLCRRVVDLGSWVAFVLPEIGQQACSVAARIIGRLRTCDEPLMTSHGDFHFRQVILPDDLPRGAAFLDRDEMCLAPAAMDLADFAAHLEAQALRGNIGETALEDAIARLGQAYGDASGRPPSRHQALYRAMKLFKLIPEPFRMREANWPGLMREVLRRTTVLLESNSA